MKIGRTFSVGLFVVVMAVTPLSAFFSGGHFEYRYPAGDFSDWYGHRVVVDDRTGLVAGIGPARQQNLGSVSNIAGSGNWLLVQWSAGGCETNSRLVFERVESAYRISVTSGGASCSFLNLTGYAITLKLWSPVDASTVTFVSEFNE